MEIRNAIEKYIACCEVEHAWQEANSKRLDSYKERFAHIRRVSEESPQMVWYNTKRSKLTDRGEILKEIVTLLRNLIETIRT